MIAKPSKDRPGMTQYFCNFDEEKQPHFIYQERFAKKFMSAGKAKYFIEERNLYGVYVQQALEVDNEETLMPIKRKVL